MSDKKIKVLHVPFGGLGYGGVSSVIFSIVENLSNKFLFDSVVFNERCEREQDFLKYGKLHRIKCYPGGNFPNFIELILRPFVLFFSIYSLCKKEKYDVIHCHNETEEGICLLAAKLAKIKIRISHSHNTLSPAKKGLLKKLRNYVSKKLISWNATTRISCSKNAGLRLFDKKDFQVIYNSIDLKKFDYRKREKQTKNTIRFVNVGRYTYQKNQEFVINIYHKINQFIPDSSLILVGFGEDKDKLNKLIKELNMEDKISLIPGKNVDISNIFANSDYMIFPSKFEGFGIVLIEAQAMGCFCFVSDAIQNEADAGLLMKLSLDLEAEQWSEIICDYINNRPLIDESNLINNLNKYSTDVISKQYESIYINS